MQSIGIKTISIFAAFASNAAVVHGLRVGVGSYQPVVGPDREDLQKDLEKLQNQKNKKT